MDINLNLTGLSEEAVAKLMLVINEATKSAEAQPKQQLKEIEVDSGERFGNYLTNLKQGRFDGYDYEQKRLKNQLTKHDTETYRELNIIHAKGKEQFWQEVKQIVEGRKEISKDNISDQLSQEDRWLIK